MSTEIIPPPNLPTSYNHAKQALVECEQMDECKDWSDKAAALASYAKQADDPELLSYAMRIKLRAVHRCGELLEQIEPGQGARDGKRAEGDHLPLNRTQAAQDAGLSEHQQKQAIRVARTNPEEFEQMVESEKPPTVTAVAELNINRTKEQIMKSLPAWSTLRTFSAWTQKHDPQEIAEAFMDHETKPAIQQTRDILEWLHNLENHLCQQTTSHRQTSTGS